MPTYPELRMLIGGDWVDSAERHPVYNPADASVVGQVPYATPDHLEQALQAAQKGLQTWRRTAPAQRANIMMKAVSLLRERIETLAHVIVLEQGKTLNQARGEVARGCDILEWDANEGRRMYGRVIPGEPGMHYTVHRQPIGVVAAFAPWNFPFSSPARKVGAALASGCALILKPSEETPAAALMLAQAFQEAGLPPGVLNVVYGRPEEISGFLIAQPAVRLIAFTGSVPVGKHLSALAGSHMKPAVMELGGHGPVIICQDADPASVAGRALEAKSLNAGQACVSPTRFFVEETVFDAFCSEFASRAAALRMGAGHRPDVDVGPLANQRRVDAIAALVDDARAQGARILTGGQRPDGDGFFYPITVLADVPAQARIMTEEPFGPVAIINPVKSLEQGITLANSLPFGLAAYAFTHSADNVARLTDEIEAGTLAINHFAASVAETPFGGVKDSGYGREGGAESLEAYTVVKTVAHQVRL